MPCLHRERFTPEERGPIPPSIREAQAPIFLDCKEDILFHRHEGIARLLREGRALNPNSSSLPESLGSPKQGASLDQNTTDIRKYGGTLKRENQQDEIIIRIPRKTQ